MTQEDIQVKAEKLYPQSYTENWEEKQSVFIRSINWYIQHSPIPELEDKIRDLKDELWDTESKVDELQEENTALKGVVDELKEELANKENNQI